MSTAGEDSYLAFSREGAEASYTGLEAVDGELSFCSHNRRVSPSCQYVLCGRFISAVPAVRDVENIAGGT